MASNGDALFRWRDALGKSQTECAEMMDPPVRQGTWAGWESGRAPDLHNALQLEEITGGKVKARDWPRVRSERRVKRRRQKSLPPPSRRVA